MKGLSRKEAEFVDRINRICEWLSRPKATRADVIKKIVDEFAKVEKDGKKTPLSQAEARKWLAKAEEVLRDGSKRQQDLARGLYAARLQRLIDTAEQYLIVERTQTVTRPVIAETGDNKGKVVGMEVVKHVRLSPEMNAAVLGQIRALMREWAHVTGARPKDPTVLLGTDVKDPNALGIPGARDIKHMGPEDLLKLAGMQDVKILPNPSTQPDRVFIENGEGDRSLPAADGAAGDDGD